MVRNGFGRSVTEQAVADHVTYAPGDGSDNCINVGRTVRSGQETVTTVPQVEPMGEQPQIEQLYKFAKGWLPRKLEPEQRTEVCDLDRNTGVTEHFVQPRRQGGGQ